MQRSTRITHCTLTKTRRNHGRQITQRGTIGRLWAYRADQAKNQRYAQRGERAKGFRYVLKQNGPALAIALVVMGFILVDPVYGVDVEELKAPIKDLKDTIFGGWMWVPKIGAAVGGCLMAVYNQSIMPLATGAGIGMGIHFYDLYIKAEGALI